MAKTQAFHYDPLLLIKKGRVTSRDLCLLKIVELAQWFAELEDRIILLSGELERLRLILFRLGVDLGLENQTH
jgi:hypothetical protein